jgi:hypothetical protein
MAKPVTLRRGRERGASVASRDLTLPEWHARTPAIHAYANRSCTFRHSKHSRDVRFTEGFRTPALCRRAGTGRGAGVRKPRKEETAGRKRRGLAGRELWGFWGRGGIAHVAAWVEGGRCYREERTRRAFSGARMRAAGVDAAAGESLRRSRGHRVRAPACGWR